MPRDAGACVDVPAPPGEDVGSGFGAVPVSAAVEGLDAGHDLLLPRGRDATRMGEAEGAAVVRDVYDAAERRRTGWPTAARWELVSPAEKYGALIYPIGGTTENGGPGVGRDRGGGDGGGGHVCGERADRRRRGRRTERLKRRR